MSETQIIEVRICRDCGQEKKIDEFSKRKYEKTGYSRQCKMCRCLEREQSGAYFSERIRKHQYRTKASVLYSEKLYERVQAAKNCEYCGDTLVQQNEHSKQATTDHIILGVNVDLNIAIVCRACNTSKYQKPVYTFYQTSERFTDELWHKFVTRFAADALRRTPTDAEVEGFKLGFEAEALEETEIKK